MKKPRGAGLTRRSALRLGALGAASLALPHVARAEGSKFLRFVPSADLAVRDPIFTTASVTANHACMVFDTLYGVDENFDPQPQMVAGHTVADDGLTWTMTLRPGLKFHDGEPVRARDVVASLRRWGARDMYGQEVLARSNEILAVDDRTLRFRLKKRFNALPAALGKNGPNICVIMPERLAATPATTQVTEMVGSGPYRYLAGEAMSGARYVYEKFSDYVPRSEGVTSRMAGPKIAYFDRIEWKIIPDQSTAAAALQAGEVDWVESLNSDLAPLFDNSRDATVHLSTDLLQSIIRFNWLQPPFDRVEIRRALIGMVSQTDYMTAAYGSDARRWKDDVGFFTSNGPMGTSVGLEPLRGRRDMAKVKEALKAAGYQGEKVVLLQATDVDNLNGLANVAADELKQAGMNVEVQASDWGSISQRRVNRGPLDKGGWSVFVTGLSNTIDPGGHLALRANGAKAWFGWPDSPRLEELRQQWFDAPDLAAQKKVCEAMQLQAMQDVPYLPVGEYRILTACKKNLVGLPPGAPFFYGVRRA